MCGIKEPSIGAVKMSGFTYENNGSSDSYRSYRQAFLTYEFH